MISQRIAAFSVFFCCFAISPAAAAAFEPEAICRATIASLKGRDPKMVRVTRTDDNVLFLSYARPIDNFVWAYRCKIQGNRVVWASDAGRWRESPKDDKIFFEVVGGGNQLRIMEEHNNGSATKQQLFDRDKIIR